MGCLLHSKEGVTKGKPLSTITYGLGILPLFRDLRADHPRVTQPWYADDSGAKGTLTGIKQNLNVLVVQGSPRGYFPEPTKSILVVSPQNVPQVEAFF